MCCGICIEALADKQKSDAKKKNPNKPAMTGLYKYSRCPNYFGEILFWTGAIVSGIGALKGWQWLIAAGTLVLVALLKISPIWILLTLIVLAVALTWQKERRAQR